LTFAFELYIEDLMMIDIHSHILPGIDDGAKTIADSITMAQKAAAEGISSIFATPHYMDGVYNCTPSDTLALCRDLNIKINEKNIPVKILPGAEIRVNHDTVQQFDNGSLLTLNNAGEHILLELPAMFIKDGVLKIIRQLSERGVVSIIAHPERNPLILKNMDIVSDLIYGGALMQITAGSLMGDFGKIKKKAAEIMIKRESVHFLSSDNHPGRKNRMADAFKKTKKIGGKEMAEKIFLKNPEAISHTERTNPKIKAY